MYLFLGIIGLIIISIAIWIKNEKKQDALFIIGGLFLFAYSVSIDNTIFSILQFVFIFSAILELMKLAKKK